MSPISHELLMFKALITLFKRHLPWCRGYLIGSQKIMGEGKHARGIEQSRSTLMPTIGRSQLQKLFPILE